MIDILNTLNGRISAKDFASIYQGNNQLFNSNVDTVLNLDTIEYAETSAMVDTSNYKLICVKSGLYLVSFYIQFHYNNATSGPRLGYILKNTETSACLFAESYAVGGQDCGVTATKLMYLNNGDYLKLVGKYIGGSFATTVVATTKATGIQMLFIGN